MSMPGSLQQVIERSFGEGPEHRPIEDRVAAGRKAVRRRRAAAAAAGVAVVAVLGTTYAVAGPEASTRSGDVAGNPSPRQDELTQRILMPGQLAAFVDGQIVLRDGVSVLHEVEDPLGTDGGIDSVALALEYRSRETWQLLTYHSGEGVGGGSITSQDPAKTTFSFEEWVANETATELRGPAGNLVEFKNGGTLGPLPGTEILDQRPGIDLGPTFARPDDPTAVAEVRFAGDLWFVVARRLAHSQPEFIATRAADAEGAATIDEFLTFARQKYAGGEGLR
jgi:hypothetical protein